MNPAPPVTSNLMAAGRLAADVGETGDEAVAPVRKNGRAFPLAAEHRIRRSRRGPPELLGRDATDATVEPLLLEDRLGEVRPGAVPAGGQMPCAAREILVDEAVHRRREVTDECWAPALVVDDRHLVPLLAEPEHRPQEVVPRGAEEPRSAGDPGIAGGRLALELRSPVRRERIRPVGLDVRLPFASVEDVVRREDGERSAERGD